MTVIRRDERRWTLRAHHAFDHVVTVERGFDSLKWGERVDVVPASQLQGAVDRAERLHEEFTVFVDACGHCLAGGRPPNQGMIDAARITLHENRGQSA